MEEKVMGGIGTLECVSYVLHIYLEDCMDDESSWSRKE